VAVLRANFFTGVNTGSSIYKMGFICLIGIAHLPESQQHIKYFHSFELRPVFTTDLAPLIAEQQERLPPKLKNILGNLFHAVKMIAAKAIPVLILSGNVKLPESELRLNQHSDLASFRAGFPLQLNSARDPRPYGDFPIAKHLTTSQDNLHKKTL
jgi:hypothetical protein